MSNGRRNRLSCQIEKVVDQMNEAKGLPFRELLSPKLVQKVLEEAGISFRVRIFDPVVTLFAFLSQVKSKDSACHGAVTRVNAQRVADGQKRASGDTSSYCKARARLPKSVLRRLTRTVGREVEDEASEPWLWFGRRVRIADGTTATMPDTEANQAAFPQPSSQKDGLGFPMLRMVIVFSLSVGTVLDAAIGRCEGKKTGENTLFREMFDLFQANDVVLGDRLFDSYHDVSLLKSRGADVVFRMNQSRKYDFRRGRRLGKGDHVVIWKKPSFDRARFDRATYDALPDVLEMRELHFQVKQPGFRPKMILVVTTLLDDKVFSKDEIAKLYRERWHCELDIRSLKPMLGLNDLRCKTPDMVVKEVWTHLLAYNLIRMKMAQAAKTYGLLPRRLSFAGALNSMRAYLPTMATDNPTVHARLQAALLEEIADKIIPYRPNRSEPRAVKRRRSKYKVLTQPRPSKTQQRKGVAA